MVGSSWPELPEAIKAGIVANMLGFWETKAFISSKPDVVKSSAVDGSASIDDRLSLHLPYGSPGLPSDLAAVVSA